MMPAGMPSDDYFKTSLDKTFHILKDVHRRRLLVALLKHTSPDTKGICVPEDKHPGEKDLDHLQTKMYHNHLPKLKEAGFIDVKSEHGIVNGPRFKEIRPLLELLHTHADELPETGV